MKTGYIRYGYDAALMILSHLTKNSTKQFVLFVTTKQSTFNFFPAPPEGVGNFFSLASLANTAPPISIFVILTLSMRPSSPGVITGKIGQINKKAEKKKKE